MNNDRIKFLLMVLYTYKLQLMLLEDEWWPFEEESLCTKFEQGKFIKLSKFMYATIYKYIQS